MQIYRLLFGLALAVSLSAQPKPANDYIPCLFDRGQDALLHAQRTPRRLIQQSLEEWVLYGYLNPRYKTPLAVTLSNRDAADFAAVLDQMKAAGILNLPAGTTPLLLANNLKSTVGAITH